MFKVYDNGVSKVSVTFYTAFSADQIIKYIENGGISGHEAETVTVTERRTVRYSRREPIEKIQK